MFNGLKGNHPVEAVVGKRHRRHITVNEFKVHVEVFPGSLHDRLFVQVDTGNTLCTGGEDRGTISVTACRIQDLALSAKIRCGVVAVKTFNFCDPAGTGNKMFVSHEIVPREVISWLILFCSWGSPPEHRSCRDMYW